MVKLIWFLVTLIAFALILVLNGYQDIPIHNEKFKVQEQKRIAVEEKKRKESQMQRPTELKTKAETPKITLVLDTPELKNGYEVYFKRGKCITCHGKKAEGKSSQQAPKLAAQHHWYLYNTLIKFKIGERINKKMQPYLRNLSDQDFKDVAAYLSKLPPQ